jgi:hypothetical protein
MFPIRHLVPVQGGPGLQAPPNGMPDCPRFRRVCRSSTRRAGRPVGKGLVIRAWVLLGDPKRTNHSNLTDEADFSVPLVAGRQHPAHPAPSPDGRFTVRISAQGVAIFNAQGRPILELDDQPSGAARFEASWSPDSARVVVVENTRSKQLGDGGLANRRVLAPRPERAT